MRRFLIAAVAIATFASAAVLAAPRAEAMTLPGAIATPKVTEDVRLVCRRSWDGYRWVRTCVEVHDGYGYGGGGYVEPRPYYPPRGYYGGGGYGGGYSSGY